MNSFTHTSKFRKKDSCTTRFCSAKGLRNKNTTIRFLTSKDGLMGSLRRFLSNIDPANLKKRRRNL